MKLKWSAPLLLLGVVLGSQASEPEPQVIDLGQTSVNGELRKPAISWIDSQKSVREALSDHLRVELKAFEAEVLSTPSLNEESSHAKH